MMPRTKREEVPGKAARLYEIPNSTLWTAIQRGEIKHRELECGTVLVDLDDVKRWKNDDTRAGRGRPPIN